MRVETIRRAGFGAVVAVALLFGARSALADVNSAPPYCIGYEPNAFACFQACQNQGDIMGKYYKDTGLCCCAGTN
jgi:hypothetical protein